MDIYEKIQYLARNQGLSVRELGNKLNIGPTTLYKWKSQTPKSDILIKVADYFNVSTDYLLGRSNDKYDLSPQEKIDIGIEAEKMMKGLNDEGSINFYGEPMSDEDKEATLSALNLLMTINRKKAKKKKDMN
ncbi:helix-turn-helix transcriptional regulator [Lactobacillus salivarius]|jgi:transcriptional regulator with XRE-family HTH domain|uniref:helix-turn-helix domain-containing protein n=1 Tax=Ligilactobacillus salivarius TaxID=1624 RepID=UPI001369A7FC|nr:helix-turn-helix transcriptional regulator [Ligilactobacillus salivarius]MYU95470.1 helix-turn-helix transcriptional regulator [Ligilactobacillus salivarius]MYZ22319.1 helix-turn-helix transcriptional regulator [Ligilactobacillus salivarius]WGT60800.1 helix-turn-helix transcriptional regulator [Ligilactobacillus salivarius]